MKNICIIITALFLLFNATDNNHEEATVIDFYDSIWVADTIDFPTARVFLSAPASSVGHSREQYFMGHGKSIYYPLKYVLNSKGIWTTQAVYFEYIVMTTHDRLINNDNIDEELWNTFDSSLRGSRAYIRNGLYTRIDILESGIAVFYEDLEAQIADIANRIIKSVVISTDKSIPLFNKRKKVTPI